MAAVKRGAAPVAALRALAHQTDRRLQRLAAASVRELVAVVFAAGVSARG